MSDQRIVSGATCVWWGSIDQVGLLPSALPPGEYGPTLRAPGGRVFFAPPNVPPNVDGIPCCPHCGGVLYEVDSVGTWWNDVDAYCRKNGDPEYRRVLEFVQHRHFFNFTQARLAYRAWLKSANIASILEKKKAPSNV